MEEGFVPREEQEEYWVSWSYSPPPITDGFINWDFTSDPIYSDIIDAAVRLKNETLFTAVKHYASADIAFSDAEHEAMHSEKMESVKDELPHAILFHPIRANPDDMESEVVAMIIAGIAWDNSLLNLLPKEIQGIYVVMDNTCGQAYTFLLNGPDATFLGDGDLHDASYDHMGKSLQFRPHEVHREYDSVGGHCVYSMHIYPSSDFEEIWDENASVIFAVVVATTFLIITMVFFIYDLFVQQRNEKLVERAARTTAIVSSLFPGQFRDKMIATSRLPNDSKPKGNGFVVAPSLPIGEDEDESRASLPLAKCYTDVTLMFAVSTKGQTLYFI